jgi:tRNA (pseudouridine54-N1)-methyltransferase
MKVIFVIKSSTVDITNYNIKDIPGSSGRLDVISRCILAALLHKDGFESNFEIWVFLDNYGTFIFNPELFDYSQFPKNELMFTDYFVSYLIKLDSKDKLNHNPLNSIKTSKMDILEAIGKFQKQNYKVFALKENGEDFFKARSKIKEENNVVFLIGSQEDEYLHSKELASLKIPTISMGTQSYLASSVIRLLRLHLLSL